MSCDTLQLCCAASTRPPCCGYCCTSTGKSCVLNVNSTRPCTVAPSSCSVSEASRAIHAFGVQVTSCPRVTNIVHSAFMDVSASRCSRGGGRSCGLPRRIGCLRGINLTLVGSSEGQRLLNMGDGQLILGRELRWRQVPGAGGDHKRLHVQARPAHDGHGLAACTA